MWPREQYSMWQQHTCSLWGQLAHVYLQTKHSLSPGERDEDCGYRMKWWGCWGTEKLRVTEMEQFTIQTCAFIEKEHSIISVLKKQLVKKYIDSPGAEFGSQVTEKARKFKQQLICKSCKDVILGSFQWSYYFSRSYLYGMIKWDNTMRSWYWIKSGAMFFTEPGEKYVT